MKSATASGKKGKSKILRQALAMSPDEVIDEVAASGLRGLGGAGFPTGVKWKMVKDAHADEKYVVCNIDEGEPGTFKDRYLIEKFPEKVISGTLIAAHAVGASRAYLYVRHEYTSGYKKLRAAIDGINIGAEIKLFKGPGGYICGEESALIESMMGRRAEPRIRPPYPAESGLFGMPTLVNNAETLANVADVIDLGAQTFKESFEKLFCLSGDVKQRGVYGAALGVTLRELIFGKGGGMRSAEDFKLAIVGGASGKVLDSGDLDRPLDYSDFGNGAVIVIDGSRDLWDVALNLAEFFSEESCGKCAPCRQGCVKAESLIRKFKTGKGSKKDMKLLQTLSQVMTDTSLCGLGQTATRVFGGLTEKFAHEMRLTR